MAVMHTFPSVFVFPVIALHIFLVSAGSAPKTAFSSLPNRAAKAYASLVADANWIPQKATKVTERNL